MPERVGVQRRQQRREVEHLHKVIGEIKGDIGRYRGIYSSGGKTSTSRPRESEASAVS